MEHLTVDEILNFVSLTELNNESIEVSAAVNGHIRKCEKCRKLVRGFQMIHDEFSRLNAGDNFKAFIAGKLYELKNENKQSVEVVNAFDEIDGFR